MFSRQAFLYLLLLLPLLLFFLRRQYKKGINDFRLLVGPWRFNAIKDAFIFKWFFSSLLLVVYFSTVVLALADIRFPENPEHEDVQGRDIIFCVDISRSMLAQDTGYSRISLVRDIIGAVVEERPGDRFGIVVFKGDAMVFIPVTEDSYILLDSLPYLGPALMTSPGTNIRRGLDLAAAAFPQQQESRKQLVLLTDGEQLAGTLDNAGHSLREKGIELIVVGLGTTEGGTIPLSDTTVVRDERGEPVVSRLDIDTLRSLAADASGTFRLIDTRGSLYPLIHEIAADKSVLYYRQRAGYRMFLLPAFLAQFLLFFLWGKRWKGL